MKTVEPPLEALVGTAVTRVWRRGKVLGVEAGALTLVVHLMQAGRMGLARRPAARPARTAALDLGLDGGGEVLRLREHSTERRMTAHLLDADGLAAHAPLTRLGPEPLGLAPEGWGAALGPPSARLHTALRDGARVAGIGRAYASDIMWAARLSPFAPADRLDADALRRLARAAEAVLVPALERARERIATDLPIREARVTAVHGHAGEPCLRCASRLERIGFTGYELVYCPRCQTGGRILADRRASRFLR